MITSRSSLGPNGGTGPTWAQGNFYDAAADTGVQANKWTDGLHAFGFGQWFKTLTTVIRSSVPMLLVS